MARFLLLLAAAICLGLAAFGVTAKRVNLALLAAALVVVAVGLLPAAETVGIRWD